MTFSVALCQIHTERWPFSLNKLTLSKDNHLLIRLLFLHFSTRGNVNFHHINILSLPPLLSSYRPGRKSQKTKVLGYSRCFCHVALTFIHLIHRGRCDYSMDVTQQHHYWQMIPVWLQNKQFHQLPEELIWRQDMDIVRVNVSTRVVYIFTESSYVWSKTNCS